jgi:hypothetical protein
MWHIWQRGDCVQDFGGETERKKTLGRLRRGWEDNIKMDIQEIRWGVDWIVRIQDGDGWRAFVNKLMNLHVS